MYVRKLVTHFETLNSVDGNVVEKIYFERDVATGALGYSDLSSLSSIMTSPNGENVNKGNSTKLAMFYASCSKLKNEDLWANDWLV